MPVLSPRYCICRGSLPHYHLQEGPAMCPCREDEDLSTAHIASSLKVPAAILGIMRTHTHLELPWESIFYMTVSAIRILAWSPPRHPFWSSRAHTHALTGTARHILPHIVIRATPELVDYVLTTLMAHFSPTTSTETTISIQSPITFLLLRPLHDIS